MDKAKEWRKMNIAWRDAFINKTNFANSNSSSSNSTLADRWLVVRYDDLNLRTGQELGRVLKFLGMDDNTTEAAMECVLSRQEGVYKRPWRPLGFDPFGGDGGEMRSVLAAKKEDVYSELGIGSPPPPPSPGKETGIAPSRNSTTVPPGQLS